MTAIAAPLSATIAPDLFSLGNRTILVTGGARGLGLTIAQSLLQSGSDVVCLDVLPAPTEPQWSEVLQMASERGLQLSYFHLDVTNEAAVSLTIAKMFVDARASHPVRGIFHSAGIQLLKEALDIEAEKFRSLIDVNLTGSFLVARAFAREWLARNPNVDGTAGSNGASIVLTASMSGRIANFGLECAAYNSSKAGVCQLARNLAMEWSKRGIRINSLSPGYIRTALTDALLEERPTLHETWLQGSLLGRLSTPDEFRGPAIFLLSDASSFMTGADLIVDGGHTAT